MTNARRLSSAALAITAATALAGGANAALLDITAITPSWENVVADPSGGNITENNTSPLVTLRWGTSTGEGPSGYDFTAGNSMTGIASDTPFLLGEFVHQNNPVTGTALESADLNVAVQIGGDGPMVNSVFRFDHDETPNTEGSCPDGSVSVCDDIVTVTNNPGAMTFTLGGNVFNFRVLGFSTDEGTTITETFLTEENNSNSAGLYAEYTVTPVPLPAAGWLLLAGIGGLGALRRVRKA